MIPGGRARVYLRKVDPGVERPLSMRIRLARVASIWAAFVLVGLTLLVPEHVGSRALVAAALSTPLWLRRRRAS